MPLVRSLQVTQTYSLWYDNDTQSLSILIWLFQTNVRSAIEIHLLDHSPAVRDAAVDLIGKYMIDSPVVAREYYPRVAERVAVCSLLPLPKRLLTEYENRTPVSLSVNVSSSC